MRDLMEKFGWTEPLMPMNAKDAKDKLEDLMKNDNYVAELKYDGSRYLCVGTPEGGRFFSRKKSENKKNPEMLGMPVEKTANVPHLSEAFKKLPFIVDGEVFYPGKKSNDVTKIMGADPEKAVARQEGEHGWLHYMVYDILYYKGRDVRGFPWYERRNMLEEAYSEYLSGHELIHLSDVYYTEPEKRRLLKWAEEHNEEGIMLKNKNGIYLSDKRPEHNWYKVKGEITYDVVIMGYEPGKGKYEGMIGSIVFGLYKDGKLTKAGTCSGMTDTMRQELTVNGESYTGKVIEIKAMERTDKGLFRHPRFIRFRNDKNAKDCLWED